MAYELVETIEVGSGGVATVTFSGIPQSGVDLLLLLSVRNNGSASSGGVRINGDTGSNYSILRLQGDGTSDSSNSYTTSSLAYTANPDDFTASTFGNSSLYIANYTSSSTKSASSAGVSENNATLAYQQLWANNWSGTDPITSLTVNSGQSLLLEHSSVSLYIIS